MKRYAAILLALGFATQSHAEQGWECTMEKQSSLTPGAVQNIIYFLPDIQNGEVYVVDPLIVHLGHEYVTAEITSNTEERLNFHWSVGDVRTTDIGTGEGAPQKWYYKAVFIRKNNNLAVRSVSGGETYTPRRGVCKKT
ncbi:MAG: hypothetical protein GYB25_09800 [Rhodobacteraceae bacterium]|nr:hypothetical protein [Paracoccaceae bacterium]